MKFELLVEYVATWFIGIVVLIGLGLVLPAAMCMLLGGHFFVSYLEIPIFGFDPFLAKLACGGITWLSFVGITKGWIIVEFLNEWQRLMDGHRAALRSLGRIADMRRA